MKRSGSLIALTLASLLYVPACGMFDEESGSGNSAVSGLPGVEFFLKRLNGPDQCTGDVLLGTGRNAGAAYILPRVAFGKNAAGEQLFQVTRMPNNSRLVTVGISFLDGRKDESRSVDDGLIHTRRCSPEVIANLLNKELAKDATQYSASQVNDLNDLNAIVQPLTLVVVSRNSIEQ